MRLLRPLSLLLLLLLLSLFALCLSQMALAAEPSSPFNTALQNLQSQIEYKFVDVDLLRRAMTHSSYSGENNRGLEALGLHTAQASAALRTLQADIDSSAAAVDARVTEVSTVDGCASAGVRLGLQKVVRVSHKTSPSEPAVVCGAFRALFGAVAVDTGKIDSAAEVFWRVQGGGAASF